VDGLGEDLVEGKPMNPETSLMAADASVLVGRGLLLAPAVAWALWAMLVSVVIEALFCAVPTTALYEGNATAARTIRRTTVTTSSSMVNPRRARLVVDMGNLPTAGSDGICGATYTLSVRALFSSSIMGFWRSKGSLIWESYDSFVPGGEHRPREPGWV
jgi:hypothetical protein